MNLAKFMNGTITKIEMSENKEEILIHTDRGGLLLSGKLFDYDTPAIGVELISKETLEEIVSHKRKLSLKKQELENLKLEIKKLENKTY